MKLLALLSLLVIITGCTTYIEEDDGNEGEIQEPEQQEPERLGPNY